MSFRVFTKTDGLEIVIDIKNVTDVEDMGDCRIVRTIMDEYEIQDTIDDVFLNDKPIYNKPTRQTKFIPIELSSN